MPCEVEHGFRAVNDANIEGTLLRGAHAARAVDCLLYQGAGGAPSVEFRP